MAEDRNIATKAEFAARMRIKPSYVRQLELDGRLVMAPDGKKILVAESEARIEATRDPSKAGVAARHARERAAEGRGSRSAAAEPVEESEDDAEPVEAPDKGSSAFQEARARREHFAALSAQRDFEQSMGRLLDASDVEDAVAEAMVVFRGRLESLRHNLSPQLAAETDEGRVAALLADEHEQALREMSRQLGNLAKADGA